MARAVEMVMIQACPVQDVRERQHVGVGRAVNQPGPRHGSLHQRELRRAARGVCVHAALCVF